MRSRINMYEGSLVHSSYLSSVDMSGKYRAYSFAFAFSSVWIDLYNNYSLYLSKNILSQTLK